MSTPTITDWSKPQAVDLLTAAFGGGMDHLLPKESEIPAEFRRHDGTKWNKIQSRWFFFGLPKETEYKPREGVNTAVALRHLMAIQGSFEPSHQHKEAAVAWLMSRWFEDVIAPELTDADYQRLRDK